MMTFANLSFQINRSNFNQTRHRYSDLLGKEIPCLINQRKAAFQINRPNFIQTRHRYSESIGKELQCLINQRKATFQINRSNFIQTRHRFEELLGKELLCLINQRNECRLPDQQVQLHPNSAQVRGITWQRTSMFNQPKA